MRLLCGTTIAYELMVFEANLKLQPTNCIWNHFVCVRVCLRVSEYNAI